MLGIVAHRIQVFAHMLGLHLNGDVQYNHETPPVFDHGISAL
jgi:hypothetical protein